MAARTARATTSNYAMGMDATRSVGSGAILCIVPIVPDDSLGYCAGELTASRLVVWMASTATGAQLDGCARTRAA